MWSSNDILETEKVIVNFAEETITWKPGMFNPKDANKFRMLIESSNNGSPVTASDFQ